METLVKSIEAMVSTEEKVFNLLENTKTNWSVTKEPLTAPDGKKTESFGIFRNDNNGWLGTVGNQYTAMQNSTMAHTIVEASNNLNLDAFRGGLLSEGEKVYYQVALSDKIVGPDTIKRYITALNSHDGSTSIGFGSSSTVVICQNTFYKALKGIEKFRHTMTAEARVQIAMETLTNAINSDNKLMESFERMTEHKVTKPILESLVKKLFGTDLGVTNKEVSTQKKNQLTAFSNGLEMEFSRHGGNTLWSLFNGVTYYTNHIETKDNKGLTKKDNIANVMIGTGLNKNLVAYDIIMDWIDENSHTPVLVKA